MLNALKNRLTRAALVTCLVWTVPGWAAVDVNQATAADLDSVKGIGPGTSARIVDARKAGPFKDWADFIARVKGIGAQSATKLSANGLTVNGATYRPGNAPPPSRPVATASAAPAGKAAEAPKKP